jgi:hypothetical protein
VFCTRSSVWRSIKEEAWQQTKSMSNGQEFSHFLWNPEVCYNGMATNQFHDVRSFLRNGQEFSHFLWNPKVCYNVNKTPTPSPDPIMSQLNPVDTLTPISLT